MKTTRFAPAAALILAAGGALSAAASPIPTAVFTNHALSPTSDVPGLPGFKFNVGTTTQFDRPFASPSGDRWVFRAIVDDPAGDKDIIISATSPTGAGASRVIMEGEAFHADVTRAYALFRGSVGINDAGAVAFSADLDGATNDDEVVVRIVNGEPELIAQEGMQAIGQAPGIGYGSLANAVHLLNDAANTVRFRSSAFSGATTQAALFEQTSLAAGSVMAQTDLTFPTSQRVLPDQTLDFLTSDRFVSSASGASYLYHGDLNGATTTDLLMVDSGAVVAQEGFPLSAEFASPVFTVSVDAGSQRISASGQHTIFRGANADGQDWVAGRAAAAFAATDRPITLKAGETELYDDAPFATTFFTNVVNSAGDRVIGGVTNAFDLNTNAVMVFNSHRVVVREGDGVDIDGNGVADDDAFVSVFNNDDAFLTDAGWLVFMADLRDGSGAAMGQAILRVRICKADWDANNATNSSDISAFLTEWLASVTGGTLLADYNNDGATNSSDISAFLTGWLAAVTGGC